jgi:hypothetical protein
LPVIVERNGSTLPQERYNTDWVTEQGMGIVLRSFRQINQALEKLLEPANFAAFRARARAYHNQALLEIPGFLDEIVQRHQSRALRLDIAARPNREVEARHPDALNSRLYTSCPT